MGHDNDDDEIDRELADQAEAQLEAVIGRLRNVDKALLADQLEGIRADRAQIAQKRQAFTDACAPLRSSIQKRKQKLIDAGYPQLQVDILLGVQDLQARIETLVGSIPPKERPVLDFMREQLGDFGDTPLGLAAMAAAPTPDTVKH